MYFEDEDVISINDVESLMAILNVLRTVGCIFMLLHNFHGHKHVEPIFTSQRLNHHRKLTIYTRLNPYSCYLSQTDFMIIDKVAKNLSGNH